MQHEPSSVRGASLNTTHVKRQADAPPRRLAVVLNDTAGTAEAQANLRERVISTFADLGIDAEVESGGGSELARLVDKAVTRVRKGAADLVVIGGGDGSIRAAASAVAGTEVGLGILPLGTRNHFARDLGLPLTIAGAAATIARGTSRSVDIATVNGETFINNSSIGVYPYLVIERERQRSRHKMTKWLAAIPALIRLTRAFPRRRLALSAEGWTRPYRTPCLFIGNNEYSMNLFTLGRRERLDRGELDVHVVKQRRPFGFFWMILRLGVGRGSERRDIENFSLKEVKVSAKSSRLPVALDGEVEIMRPPLLYRSLPNALRVIVPDIADGAERLSSA